MKVLITGISGFSGSHLAEYLLNLQNPSIQVMGTYLHLDAVKKNLKTIAAKIKLFKCDVTQPSEIKKIIQDSSFDLIFHLAGTAYVPQAEEDHLSTYQINTFSAEHLLDGVLQNSRQTKVMLFSTSEVYGKVLPKDIPLTELTPVNPYNVYGTSKAMMELIGQYYVNRHGLKVIILRPFNHIGPRQSDRFVISNFSRQIAKIKLGMHSPCLEVGDLEPQRDFTDVRDIVRGYWLAARHGKEGETYNIASGTSHSIREISSMLIHLAECPIEIKPDQNRMRKSDLPILEGSPDKLRQDTGWQPKYSLKETLEETLNYWLEEEAP